MVVLCLGVCGLLGGFWSKSFSSVLWSFSCLFFGFLESYRLGRFREYRLVSLRYFRVSLFFVRVWLVSEFFLSGFVGGFGVWW